MMSLIIMFGIAFVFFILFVYCGISLISNLVFAFLEWRIKRRYVNEVLKELAALPLRWKEEKLQKWYVLLAIIVCGLVWMPSFVAVIDFDNDMDYDMDNVIETDNKIKIEEEPLSTSERYGIPEPYYTRSSSTEERVAVDHLVAGSTPACEIKSISELREVLKEIKYPHGYEECVFDCSNMASFCEHFLENKGFNASILANGTWGHAWISVYANGKNVNIECIPPVHITSYEKYNCPEDVYTDIYESLESAYPWEFDWWSK